MASVDFSYKLHFAEKQHINNYLKHCDEEERSKKKVHANKQIDKSRTKDNVILYDISYEQKKEKLKKSYEIHKSHKTKRGKSKALKDDTVVLQSLYVPLPEGLVNAGKDVQVEFFRKCEQILLQHMGGEDNLIACEIHYDEIHEYYDKVLKQLTESRVHMHYGYTPLLNDKFNCKAMSSTDVIIAVDNEIDDMCQRDYGVPYLVHGKAEAHNPDKAQWSNNGKSVEQLKIETYQATIKRAASVQEHEERISKRQATVGKREQAANKRDEKLDRREAELDRRETAVSDREKYQIDIADAIESFESYRRDQAQQLTARETAVSEREAAADAAEVEIRRKRKQSKEQAEEERKRIIAEAEAKAAKIIKAAADAAAEVQLQIVQQQAELDKLRTDIAETEQEMHKTVDYYDDLIEQKWTVNKQITADNEIKFKRAEIADDYLTAMQIEHPKLTEVMKSEGSKALTVKDRQKMNDYNNKILQQSRQGDKELALLDTP